MGKIRTRILGMEELEKQQKEEQKQRSLAKKKVRQSEVKEEEKRKMSKTDEKTTDKVVKTKQKKEIKTHVRSENYQKAKKTFDNGKFYSLEEAVDILQKIKYAKFDESVELHLNVDETGLKGEVSLPHSTGKKIRVAIVDDKVLADLEKGKIDYDVLIAHPSFMPRLTKFARVLGPKGLMPNPKAGTISTNPEEVAKKFEKGVLRWKTEAKFPLIHQIIGKISFTKKDLVENAKAFIDSVGKAHIKKAFIKTTMSPSVKLNLGKV